MSPASSKRVPYRNLGDSQLKVSRLCVGAMMFGDQTDEPVAREIVAHAHDHGINFIDTADVYSTGKSESMPSSFVRPNEPASLNEQYAARETAYRSSIRLRRVRAPP